MKAFWVLMITLVLAGPAAAYDREDIPHTVWPEQFRDHEITLEGWNAAHPRSGPLKREVLFQRSPESRALDRGRVAVLVDDGLQAAIEGSLEIFADDLARDGHSVLVEALGGGSAEDLKAHLQDLHAEDLVGAILIGPLPSGWYEIANDYNEYGYTQFPCDLFYMDLDGSWADNDGDGRYDAHGSGVGGDTHPEIWIGHLLSTPTMGDAAALLNDYFARNHQFRRGEILGDGSALVYVDDDWTYWTPEYVQELTSAFPDVTSEQAVNTTSVDDYLPRLQQAYDNVAVFVHSSPEAHFFVKNGQYDYMMYSQVPQPADALFYNLFACSNANFGDYVFMAGVYVLNTDYGLLAVGSTKTGSMMWNTPYYTELSQYGSFGDGVLSWWDSIAPYSFDDICWFYGVTLIGDPTLRIGYPTIGTNPEQIGVEAEDDEPIVVAVELGNLGADHIEWTVSVDAGWLAVTPEQGAGHSEVTLTLDPAAADEGTNHGTLWIEAPGATNNPLGIPVELTIPPPPDGGDDDDGPGGSGCQGCAGGGGTVTASVGLLLLFGTGLRRRSRRSGRARLPNR